MVGSCKIAEEGKIIAQRLGEIDPKNKELYQANAQKLEKRCEELVARYQPLFDKAKQKTFVTQHTAFSYLAKRFGLKQLGIAGISPEQEPTARQLAEIQQFVKDYKVKRSLWKSTRRQKWQIVLPRQQGRVSRSWIHWKLIRK